MKEDLVIEYRYLQLRQLLKSTVAENEISGAPKIFHSAKIDFEFLLKWKIFGAPKHSIFLRSGRKTYKKITHSNVQF